MISKAYRTKYHEGRILAKMLSLIIIYPILPEKAVDEKLIKEAGYAQQRNSE